MGVLLSGILRNVSDLQEMVQQNGPTEPSEQPSREGCNHTLYIYCSSCGNKNQPQLRVIFIKCAKIGDADTENERENVVTRPPQLPLVHDVLCGETLSSISQLYGVSVDAIVAYNEIRDANRIYAGSALQIPGVITESLP